MSALAVRRLTKRYTSLFGKPLLALDGLDLAVPKGAAFGLIGPNGAGKTTFIKLLLGVARPTGGEIDVLGGQPEDLAVRQRIGYLPERMHLPAASRGKDVLRTVATLKRLDVSDRELALALERVGLGVVDRRVGSYSKGMRQRLGLAAAMLGQPDLLVLDEPTDGIDPLGRVEVRRLLEEEKRRGATLVLNSHLLSETERVCDRIGILHQGKLRLEGTLDEIRRVERRWVARFDAGADAAALAGAGFVAEGAGWAFAGADVDALNVALDAARASGAKLVELTAASRDLEAVLADALGEARA